jgi:hypothetical protein
MEASSFRWWTALRAGAEAGLCATLAMSVAMYGLQRAGLLGRMPPRTIVRRSLAKVGLRGTSDRTDRVLSTVAHFGFGASQGALYALAHEAKAELEPRAEPTGSANTSIPFALLVWAANYAGWLPAARLFPSPARDRPGRPTSMVLAHGVFGYVLGQVFPRRLRRLRA